MRPTNLTLEACVETLHDAIRAEHCGANRIELCGDLSVGGVTPSEELTLACLQGLKIPIMAMVRPRGGDFVYTDTEIEAMKNDIQYFKSVGVAGVVFGILDENGGVDIARTRELSELAKPLLVTFHKAIDDTPDPVVAIEHLTQIPDIQRVLTSGGKSTAMEGSEILRKMRAVAEGKIKIIAAGKVTKENLMQVHTAVRTTEYHGKRIVF
ncbi:MAG: copper homeostasis protein CutC [Saprospiraceae bacterium]|nr:copper homeostasis protein CutC [Saprospiraceae bacterium]MCF8248345.1 copper homeostasis protein CutC [Saprospiraceae bacterium]MCF8280216.1 copper homeostasis protein CutC [Bacteroidales bacterium]MCF8309873.1 copper homeostasis protein CutC [Saprospiraceae bacterium]MCF8438796.1 copper homeostasis protein CutC [Saprospiraceae bacterium]